MNNKTQDKIKQTPSPSLSKSKDKVFEDPLPLERHPCFPLFCALPFAQTPPPPPSTLLLTPLLQKKELTGLLPLEYAF